MRDGVDHRSKQNTYRQTDMYAMGQGLIEQHEAYSARRYSRGNDSRDFALIMITAFSMMEIMKIERG